MGIKIIVSEYTNTRIIKLITLLLTVASLTGSNAFALDPMGPTTSCLRHGESEIGIDYINSTMDLELSSGKWTESLNGTLIGAGEAVSFDLKDFETSKIYATLGYGIWEGCDVYLRLGGVNTEFGDSLWEAGEKFDSDTNYSFCIGSRATFYEIGELDIGRLIQLSWVNIDGDLKVPLPAYPQPDDIDIELMEVQFAIGATYTAPNGSSIYGGPFIHYVTGDLEDEYTDTSGLTSNYTWDIGETSMFGGYFGAQLYIAQNTFMNIEYQRTGGADAFGLSFLYRF